MLSSVPGRFPPHLTIILLSPAPQHLAHPSTGLLGVLLGEGWTEPDGNRPFFCHLCGWVVIFGVWGPFRGAGAVLEGNTGGNES